MARVLIQFAHPAFSKSTIHRTLIDYCRNLNNVTFNDLYEKYPDMFIDVAAEQKLLLQHDIILFQHPFYWYSSPAIVKQWLDLVLEHNWAYGSRGNALAGKKMGCVVSCGGGPDTYQETGRNRYSVNQFLLPFEQTAHLCKMEYLPPFVIYGTFRITKEEVIQSSEQYRLILEAIANDQLSSINFQDVTYLNELIPVFQATK